MNAFSEVIAALGEEFGALDNQIEKWHGREKTMAAYFPQIEIGLKAHFAPDSEPITVFEQAAHHYQSLLTGLAGDANGYLNLRFYIMLNGFLAACRESLEKAALNESLDPAGLVVKSYYTPFFFERAALTTDEVRQMLDADLEQLAATGRDLRGVLAAERIRKGTASMLAESYCPKHPALYPLVAALDKIRARKDPSVIDEVAEAIAGIRAGLELEEKEI
jgi:hypothetical protein